MKRKEACIRFSCESKTLLKSMTLYFSSYFSLPDFR